MTDRIVRYKDNPPMFAGSGIPVAQVVAAVRGGETLAQLARRFPRLSVADLTAAREYAFAHQDQCEVLR